MPLDPTIKIHVVNEFVQWLEDNGIFTDNHNLSKLLQAKQKFIEEIDEDAN